MSKESLEEKNIKKNKKSIYLNNKNNLPYNNIINDSFVTISKISNKSISTLNQNNIDPLLIIEDNKQKYLYHEQSKRHPKCSSCTNKYENILYKNKSALSDFILNNAITKKNNYYPNIKLLGNSRYKYSSPLLYVEDQKNNLSNSRLGLIPIPLEKFKKKIKNEEDEEEEKNLYNLQRSIVMSRRFQYNKNKNLKKEKNKNNEENFDFYNKEKEKGNNYLNKIVLIQRWWKNISKKNNIKKRIEDFVNKLNRIKLRKVFNELKNLILLKNVLNEICYISKNKYINSRFFNQKIRTIQNKYRKYIKYDNRLAGVKKKLISFNYIDKIRYRNSYKYINDAIKAIQKNFRIYKANKLNKNLDNNKQYCLNNNLKKDVKNKDNKEKNHFDYLENLNNEENKRSVYNKDVKEVNDSSGYNIKNNKSYFESQNNNIIPQKNENNPQKKEEKNSIVNNSLINSKRNKEVNNKDKIGNINNKEKKDSNENKEKKFNNDKDLLPLGNNGNKKNINKRSYNNIINNKNENKNDNQNNKTNQRKKDIINYNILKDIINYKNETKKNNNKILEFLNIINKCLYSYPFKKFIYYCNLPTYNLPKILICYITKEKELIKRIKFQKYKNKINNNIIEKIEIQINNNEDYIEKIYRKPIINGKSFKYQYYFSNNPYSQMNICYISKINIKNNNIYESIKNYNKINNLKFNKLNNGKIKTQNNISKIFSRDINDYIIINNNTNETNIYINKIKKVLKNGYFISKKIFKKKNKDIIKIQRQFRQLAFPKNKVFKRPSYTYTDYKKLINGENDLFDTENVQAMIILNKEKKKKFIKSKELSNSSKKDVKEELNGINKNINNLLNHSKPSNDLLNEIYNEQENNLDESDSEIITKIKLNYDSIKENKNDNNNIENCNNFIIKQFNSSKDIFYITKKRKINYIKNLTKLQNLYKNHLYLKKSKNNFTNINTFQKPKNKNCFLSIQRFIKTKTDRYMFIYNPKLKYFIFLLKLFIIKNIQEYIFKLIKDKIIYNNRKDKYFGFPFYIRAIQRVINFLNRNNNSNRKVILFFNEIFIYDNNKFKYILNKLCFLSKKEKSQLINSNIFTGYEENELIHFLCDFSDFDKNLNNEEFITERLGKTKLNDTNIFTLIKFIDDEYENLVNGEYCLKCFNNINICKCFKYKNIDEIEKDDINDQENCMEEDFEIFDRELNDDESFNSKRKINCFNYNTNNDNIVNLLIKTKSNLNKNNYKKLMDIIIPNEEFNNQ